MMIEIGFTSGLVGKHDVAVALEHLYTALERRLPLEYWDVFDLGSLELTLEGFEYHPGQTHPRFKPERITSGLLSSQSAVSMPYPGRRSSVMLTLRLAIAFAKALSDDCALMMASSIRRWRVCSSGMQGTMSIWKLRSSAYSRRQHRCFSCTGLSIRRALR